MLELPLFLALAAVMLLTLTVRLDPASLVIGSAPTVAVIVNYYLAKRQRIAIAREQAAAVGEVHELVNGSQKVLEEKIETLEAELRELRGVPSS